MKKFNVFTIITIGLITLLSFQINKDQTPYLLTKLSPYLEDSSNSSIKREMIAELETGFDDSDSLQIHIGTAKKGDIPLFWMKIESIPFEENTESFTDMSKTDKSLNVCRDTIKYTFNGDTAMIAFEKIHHLQTDEIQYIWLDENNNRSKKAIIIPLDPLLKVGKIFPALTVNQLNGEKLSINDLAGKIIIISFWETICSPCVDEIPGFNILVEKYKNNPNVVFIAISNDNKERTICFLKEKEFNYIQTLLATEEASKIFGTALPVNIIINPAGKISHYYRGGYPDKYLEIGQIIDKLLD